MHGAREPPFDCDDVTSIINGLFEVNAKLADIAEDVGATRGLMDEDDEEA